MANTTWNPVDKTANTTLSNGNLTVAFAGASGGVRSVYSASSGKWYWEVTFSSGSAPGIGFANASAILSSVWSNSTNALIAYNGSAYVNNSLQSGINVVIQIGHIIAVAGDFGAKRVWFRNVSLSGNWNGIAGNDPATTVGGANITVIGSPLFAILAGNASATWNANFGDAAFTGAVPAGFASGFGAAPTGNASFIM